MKTLVPSKLILACILAAGALAWQRGWWVANPSGARVASSDSPAVAVATPSAAAGASHLPVEAAGHVIATAQAPAGSRALVSATVRRADPFAYPPSVVEVMEPPGEPIKPEPEALVLQAISLDGDSALAVINRQIVAVNEHVDVWRVDRIESHVVWLEGPEGRRALRFPGAPETARPVPAVAALAPWLTPDSVPLPGDNP